MRKTKGGVAYEERGSGFPFVALHGYTLDRRMSLGAFEPLFDAEGRAALPPSAGAGRPEGGRSSRSYRRIYLDLPCMGESADLEEASSDAMLAATLDAIGELTGGGDFLLAGQSYGGYLARGAARALGPRVAGLFLLCPAIVIRRALRDLPPPAVLRDEEGWAAGAAEEEIEGFKECSVARTRYTFERTRAEILSGIGVARMGLLERIISEGFAFSFDRPAAYPEGAFDARFERPACFVLGRQDSTVGWKNALALAGRYPRASFHVLDAAGHNLQLEQAGLLASAFGAWIGACEAWAGA